MPHNTQPSSRQGRWSLPAADFTQLSVLSLFLVFCPFLWDPWGWGRELRNASWVIQELLSELIAPTSGRNVIFASNTFKTIVGWKEITFPQLFPKGNMEPRSVQYPSVWLSALSEVCASYKEQIRKHDTQLTDHEANIGSLSTEISDQFDFPSLFFKFPFLFLFPSHLTIAFCAAFLFFFFFCTSFPLFSRIQLLSILSAAAAAQLLHSCLTLCNPVDGSPPGSPVPGILQARLLEIPSPMHESEKWKWSRSVVSNSERPHGLQPTRLLRLWDFPGKSTGVECHCLLRFILSILMQFQPLPSFSVLVLSAFPGDLCWVTSWAHNPNQENSPESQGRWKGALSYLVTRLRVAHCCGGDALWSFLSPE